MLGNLLSNAVKYSPDGGEIVVTVEDAGGEARVAVADRGHGIAPEVLRRLFGRFYRVRDTAHGIRGLGLGLFITRSLVEAHGGRIWAGAAAFGTAPSSRLAFPSVRPDQPEPLAG